MIGIKVKIIRYISNDQPGVVECKFHDAWDREFTIQEKVPVVTRDNLNERSEYPRHGVIACQTIKEWTDLDGRKLVTIDIDKPWAIQTIDGLTQFDILQNDLTEI